MSEGRSTNPWAIAIVVALAAFMEVLDTSIANVALPHIAGSLSATADQSTWVLTSYLVSNAIVLPLTGWFVSIVGRKRLFLICLTIFTVSSLLCGVAPSLGAMIFFRILQGAGGGGLQPMAQAILADTFPPRQRGLAFAVFGVTVIVAPVLGPTLGGWLTDNFDWRWIFFINLPVGIAAVFLISRLIEDPPWQGRRARDSIRVDYTGISLLVVGVAALQVMLDKGQQLDWFASGLIVALALVAVVALTALVLWEWRHDDPVIDVRLYRNRNFLSANIMMFTAGVVMFSGLVMMPQYLQLLMGYSAESAGLVLSGGGLLLMVMMPLSGILSSRVQARYLVTAGWCLASAGMFYTSTHLDLNMSFWDAAFLRVVQVAGFPLLFVPIILISYVGVPPEKSNSVAGLVSFMRNIGSGIGTSLVTTMVAQRAQLHHAHLIEHTNSANPLFTGAIAGLAQQLSFRGADASRATMQAYDDVYRAVIAQAAALAYIDVFWVLAVGAAIMAPLSLTLRRNDPRAGAVGSVTH